MSIIRKMLKYDVCTYWAPTGVDNQGRPTYTGTSPIEIQCRWEDTNEQMVDKTGRQRTSRSIVYVDRDIDVNGALTHSSLDAIQFVTDPFKNPRPGKFRGSIVFLLSGTESNLGKRISDG